MIEKSDSNTKNFLLIELLQTFEKKEIERFKQFISNDYFNRDQHLILLLDALRKHILNKKKFEAALQTKVYKAIFSITSIEKDLLNKEQKKDLLTKMSSLIKLAKRFLMIEALEDSPSCKSELLNKKLLEKKQLKLIGRNTAKDKKELANQTIKDLTYYAHSFQIELNRMHYFHQMGMLIKEDNFTELIHDLDMFYLINKLQFFGTMYSIENLTSQKSYNFDTLEANKKLLALPKYAKEPLIILYNTSIQLMENRKEKIYIDLLKLLNQYETIISKNNLIDFYAIAGNFCAFQIRAGVLSYKKKTLELYKIMHAKNILIDKNLIDLVKLKNIVTLSCHLQDFKWAIEIINEYYASIKKEFQKSVYHFNLGLIDFYQSNYKEAIKHFIRVNKVNLAYDVDCKILLLKAYYQMDKHYDERTMQIFRSTERYININKSMPFSHKRSYKNFIQIAINLYRIKHRVGKRTLESMQNKLAKMDFINDKKWLLEKMEDIASLP